MFTNRRQRRGGLGLLLLLERVLSVGDVGPVTLLTIAGQSLLYMGIINPPWRNYEVCLSAESILRHKSYSRLLLSAIEHTDDIHLYHNMVSFLFKGRTLERLFGSVKFFILLVVLTLAEGLTYVGLAYAASQYFESYSYMRECAVGFSGVIFALKVLTTHYERNHYSQVLFFTVPSKYAVWAELIVIHILVPHASFIGHLAGILVGIMYVYGPLSEVVNAIHTTVAGPPRPSYTYAHGTTRGHTLR